MGNAKLSLKRGINLITSAGTDSLLSHWTVQCEWGVTPDLLYTSFPSVLSHLCFHVLSVWFLKCSKCLNRGVQAPMAWFSLHSSLHYWFSAKEVTHTLVCAACDVLLVFFVGLKQIFDSKWLQVSCCPCHDTLHVYSGTLFRKNLSVWE